MKSIYIIVILFLGVLNSNAQEIFLGTWEHKQNNEIFRIILKEDNELQYIDMVGNYEKVRIDPNSIGTETYIYCSDKEKFMGNNDFWLPFLISFSGTNQKVQGSILDNTVNGNLYYPAKSGRVFLEIISNTGGTNPIIKARWRVKRGQGPYLNEAPEYSVPTDIILTKKN